MKHSRFTRASVGISAFVIVCSLTACSSVDVRKNALLDAHITLEKVVALSVEDAGSLDTATYAHAVSTGRAWPKPTFDAVRSTPGDTASLPSWATGVSFNVNVQRTEDYQSEVHVDYAVSGHSSAGSGSNLESSDVVLCVRIHIRFRGEAVDSYVESPVESIRCPADVKTFYGVSELVPLAEVLSAGQ